MQPLDIDTCAQAFRRLDDYLDRELAPEEVARVEAHLATCSECAAEFRFEATVLAQIRLKLQHLDVPEGLLRRIAAQLQPHCGSRRRKASRREPRRPRRH